MAKLLIGRSDEILHLEAGAGITFERYGDTLRILQQGGSGLPALGADETYLRSNGILAVYSPLLIGDFPEGGAWDLNTTDLTLTNGHLKLGTAGKGYYERARATALGEWIAVPYNGANFTGLGGQTWTVEAGDQITYAYTLIGKTMVLAFALNGTSVGGTPNPTLDIAIPGGFTAAKQLVQPARVSDNGTDQWGLSYPTVGGSTIHIQKIGAANMQASVNNTVIQGVHFIEVQ